jgi:hypothetical protein
MICVKSGYVYWELVDGDYNYIGNLYEDLQGIAISHDQRQKAISLELDIDGNEIIGIDWAVSVPDKKSNGMSCSKCNNFNEYAEPNQEDGTHKCYRCRKGL